MKKILTVIGARPQIIKASAISRAIKTHFSDYLEEVILHTGQHYDQNMSEVFFEELSIPKPQYNLKIGSGSHGSQTAYMIEGIENVLLQEKPSALVVYGDTNSTLAGSIAASKLHIPIIHIEAGLRSFNKTMPEEINRILCDHTSTLLFCPTQTAVENLKREGLNLENKAPYNMDNPKVFYCGDIMYDNSLYFSDISSKKITLLKDLGLENTPFILSTIHRPSNTDNPKNLASIFSALLTLSEHHSKTIVLPLHPRTKNLLEQNLPPDLYASIQKNGNIKLIPPTSFLEMIALEKNAEIVITDSGGVQKEAYFFNKPCIILREETEWVEIVDIGCAILTGPNEEKILKAYEHFSTKKLTYPSIFGDGKASQFICQEIISL